MLLLAISDKGGTGRSVTSTNLVYRCALQGQDVCYVDFDFGSPTVGAIFQIPPVERGTDQGGTHSYIRGHVPEPHRVDVWISSDRDALRTKPPSSGQIVLLPGDVNGGEFPVTSEGVERCVELFAELTSQFDVVLVDLSSGRSAAAEIALAATAHPALRDVTARWLVFHRWTSQHIIAANGLVNGERGLLSVGANRGHDPDVLRDSIRYVRTAVVDVNLPQFRELPQSQLMWLVNCNRDLQRLATENRLGRTVMLGIIPLDPVLQWREQIISDEDVWDTGISNEATINAFSELAKRIADPSVWVGL